VGGLDWDNLDMVNLSRSVLKSDQDPLHKTMVKLKTNKLNDDDIDILSNSVVCGTGTLLDLVRDQIGYWHIPHRLT
jgi:hypothetical protein